MWVTQASWPTMRRFLTISVPATGLALLSIDELREAAGVTGSADDARLLRMGLAVAAAITAECNVAVGSGGEPTLLRETLVETIYGVGVAELVLRRRHDVAIASVVEDAVTLAATDYAVDPESGLLTRLCSDIVTGWRAAKVVVTYQAGFATPPSDLKMAAADFVRLAWREKDRDPALKGREIDVPGVERIREDYWVGAIPGQAAEGAVPDVVAGQLARYRNLAHGG